MSRSVSSKVPKITEEVKKVPPSETRQPLMLKSMVAEARKQQPLGRNADFGGV